MRSETATRVLTSAVLAPAVVFLIVSGGLPFVALVLLVTLLGQSEFYRLIRDKGAQPLVGLGLALGAAVVSVTYLGNEYHTNLLLAASLLVLMAAQLRKAQISESLASLSGTFFGVFYVAWLLSHTVVLRFFYETAAGRYSVQELETAGIVPGCGIFFVLYTLAVVVGCDTGAYFLGRRFGRHKLAPGISPGKTVEGAVGGVLVAVLMGALFKGIFDLAWPALSAGLPWVALAPISVAVALAGIVGDLVESMLKRDAEVKDTGALLPGMGGVLDRIDAILVAFPVSYYVLTGYLYGSLRLA